MFTLVSFNPYSTSLSESIETSSVYARIIGVDHERECEVVRAERRDSVMTAILGSSASYHDSAATLVIDGEIIAAAQEEHFTPKKHDYDLLVVHCGVVKGWEKRPW